MEAAIISITIIYVAFVFWLIYGWKQWPKVNGTVDNPLFFTVVVPVRNEAANIRALLESLNKQHYPADSFEVIVVDDGSDDDTAQIVQAFESSYRLKLLKNEYASTMSPKKAAITMAVAEGEGTHILTTDGDCCVPANWLNHYNEVFKEPQKTFAFGPVSYHEEKGFWKQVLQIELASLIVSGAALLRLKLPCMCNGANLGFHKSTFRSLKGYEGVEHIISGDDELLMHKFYHNNPRSVAFVRSGAALVTTNTPGTLSAFLHQRRRWSGKWDGYQLWQPKVVALFIFVVHLNFLFCYAFTALGWMSPIWLIGVLGIKFVVEIVLIRQRFRMAGQSLPLLPLIFLVPVYSFYVVVFGIFANFGSYEWKGRKHKK